LGIGPLVLLTLAVALGGVVGFMLIDAIAGISARGRDRSRARRRLQVHDTTVVNDLKPVTPLARFVGSTRIGGTLRARLTASGLTISFDALVRRLAMAAGFALIGGALVFGNVLPGIVLMVAAIVLPYVWLQGRAESRLEEMERQLPDAFTLVGNSLGSGLSLVQALQYAADETAAPLGPYLWALVNDVSAGISLSDALERLRAAVPLKELRTVSTALEIQRRTGGNMREMLESATAAVRERLELKMSLSAQTAQGKLSSKVVGFLPLVLTGLIVLADHTYLDPFIKTPVGIVLLMAALTAEVVGFMLIRRIVEVDI